MPHPFKTEFSFNHLAHQQVSTEWNGGALLSVLQCGLSAVFHVIVVFNLAGSRRDDEETLLYTMSIIYLIWSIVSLIIGAYFKNQSNNAVAYKFYNSNSFLIVFTATLVFVWQLEDLIGLSILFLLLSVGSGIACIALNIFGNKENATVSNNIERGYLNIKHDMICGISFTDIKVPGNGDYFELPLENIRYIEIITSELCNLMIHHKNGTYRLCIESPDIAKTNIEEMIHLSKKQPQSDNPPTQSNGDSRVEQTVVSHFDSAQSHSIPVHVHINQHGQILCPRCGTEQNNNRYRCYHCEQVFINGQPNIPYWCGKCGESGPYNDACPNCSSTLKIYNI